MSEETATINIELTSGESWALAELAKRIGWTELRQLAASDEEADTMQAAMVKVGRALAEYGFKPR